MHQIDTGLCGLLQKCVIDLSCFYTTTQAHPGFEEFTVICFSTTRSQAPRLVQDIPAAFSLLLTPICSNLTQRLSYTAYVFGYFALRWNCYSA